MPKIKFQTIPIIIKKVDKNFRPIETSSIYGTAIKDELPIAEAVKKFPIESIQLDEEKDSDDLNILDKQFVFVTGAAGTGKTYTINKYNLRHPDYIELCATTGIAAINLNTKTVNSTLKYYDTDSLRDSYMDQ